MKYKELLIILNSLTEEELQSDVTIYTPGNLCSGECYAIQEAVYHVTPKSELDGVLDHGHPYLAIKTY